MKKDETGIISFIPSRDEQGNGITRSCDNQKKLAERRGVLQLGLEGIMAIKNNSKRRRYLQIWNNKTK